MREYFLGQIIQNTKRKIEFSKSMIRKKQIVVNKGSELLVYTVSIQ